MMDALRKKMDIFKININDKRNGVWLPKNESARIPGTNTTPHKGAGVHGKAYKQYVFETLSGAQTREEFLNSLSMIKKSLADGIEFPKAR
ncbi:hypothetical protein ALO94_03042 [Pseudomonas syringae pv. spinaceae]|uniref:Uncharacterized protein n=1 Tax=Pseudomonas syringae pv. spinaceae TaxID=264459 RepID=A0A0Q0A627_PSESX|nr:hypothetical protein ALO94_03042 [Pseudomonas syringae pv. spinaceae]